ncbi:aminopeptidase N-like isoform X1 [Schistocerca piceifrons]|uniref:aminopeptidase N-like isoform X1 n=1 Tax=Schistocerca piceifrons TaxID=274613 RepID=UPI001F5FBC14|nr:aminopeptidase N-like isoform X1 [Schistocerca piceifrons]
MEHLFLCAASRWCVMTVVRCLAALVLLAAAAHGQSDRLPGESWPLRQRVDLTVHLGDEGDSSFTFEGRTNLTVVAVRNTTQIVLHAALGISSVTAYDASGSPVSSSYEQGAFLVVTLAEQLTSGSSITLEVDFSGEIGYREDGFARYDYLENGQEKAIYATQFEPNFARSALPCYDEPAVKTFYTLSVRVPDGYTVLSNTPASSIDESPDEDGFRTFQFEETPPMSAYLLAWVVLNTSSVVSPSDPATTIWTVDSTLPQAVYSSIITPSTVSAMEQLVGVPYTLTKLDHVAIPSFIEGGMENWGLITYTQGSLLVLENYTSEATKEQSLGTIQHEVAHQWFGDLVTCDWWNALWLNEGFATYFQWIATDVVEPTWRQREVFAVTTLLQTAMTADVSGEEYPLTKNPNITADQAFMDYNIYQKGASIIWMIENVMGSDAFFKGLFNYLRNNMFSAATDDLLLRTLDYVTPDSYLPEGTYLEEVMLPWVRQGGFPFISVSRNYTDGSAIISQAPYLSDADTVWPVPITYTSRSEANFSASPPRLWLLDSELEVPAVAQPDDWLLLNLHVAGYYRVNYDEQNWALLTEQLRSDPEAIPPANRGQLLDDSASLSGAAYVLSAEAALRLHSYLSRERDYIPWRVASGTLLNMERLVGWDAPEQYNEFALSVLEHMTDELGYREVPGEDHVTRILRAIIVNLACNYGQQACLNSTYEQMERFMADPPNPDNQVDPDLRRIVYCQGVRYFGADVYNFLMDRYATTEVISEMNDILLGATCSEMVAGLRMLELTAAGGQGGFRREHLLRLLEGLLQQKQGIPTALQFLSHSAHLLTWPGEKAAVRKLVMGATLNMYEQELLDQVERVADALEDKSLHRAAQRRRDVIARGETARKEAARWLRERRWEHL